MNKWLYFIGFLFLYLCFPAKAASGMLTEDGKSLNREQSAEWVSVWVNYHDRICPLQTLAIDFTTKLTGKSRYNNLNAEQFLLGWLFFPEQWQDVPLFEFKHPKLKEVINSSGKACFSDFFEKDGFYKLDLYRKEMYGAEKQTAFAKEAIRLDEKIQLIHMLHEGNLLKIFPFTSADGTTRWFSPSDMLPEKTDSVHMLVVHNILPLYLEYARENRSEDALRVIQGLQRLQQKNAAGALPSESHLKAELINNQVNIFSWLFKINLTAGFIGLLLFLFCMIRDKKTNRIHRFFYGFLIITFLLQTAGLCLRGYIAGRLPMSNGYETMLIVAWSALFIGLLCYRRSFLITVFSLLLSGFTLLVAHIGSMNPHITPLVPVLQSPLLSIHVSFIMVAYGLCGFMLLNSLTSFSLLAFGRKNPQTSVTLTNMKEMSELFMYPATFFMGAGIFIGAIWANVSWGRYWGWDPKEVWALITFLLMSFSFHGKTLKWFNRPVFYHFFVLIIFAAVLMTYFGVNYILGGKHSYAGG